MLEVFPALKAHLNTGATTLCYVWMLTRRDGLMLGFTDHDRDLLIDEAIYKAAAGMDGATVDSRLGFAVDNGSVDGVLSDDRITAQDIRDGLYAGARFECARVNWAKPAQRVALRRGYIGDITLQGDRYNIEWIGEARRLNRSQGRVFSRQCDAEFGDNSCGLDLSDFQEGTQCDRRFATCRDRFHNTDNFRGFPYILGDDALTAGSPEGERRDGSSRYNTEA